MKTALLAAAIALFGKHPAGDQLKIESARAAALAARYDYDQHKEAMLQAQLAATQEQVQANIAATEYQKQLGLLKIACAPVDIDEKTLSCKGETK